MSYGTGNPSHFKKRTSQQEIITGKYDEVAFEAAHKIALLLLERKEFYGRANRNHLPDDKLSCFDVGYITALVDYILAKSIGYINDVQVIERERANED